MAAATKCDQCGKHTPTPQSWIHVDRGGCDLVGDYCHRDCLTAKLAKLEIAYAELDAQLAAYAATPPSIRS